MKEKKEIEIDLNKGKYKIEIFEKKHVLEIENMKFIVGERSKKEGKEYNQRREEMKILEKNKIGKEDFFNKMKDYIQGDKKNLFLFINLFLDIYQYTINILIL